MNEPGLPQAITAASLIVSVLVVGNMISRIGKSGRKRTNKRRKPLP
jgi:hypothetical protein